MLGKAKALAVPVPLDPDAPVMPVLDFARAAGIEPDEWQAAVLASEARKHLLLCSRQAGKSTVASLLASYEAAFNPGSLTLMLAPSLRQSSELFRTTMGVLRTVESIVPAVASESALRVELVNGSRIVALPGSSENTRGYAGCSLLIVDEASRVPDELLVAVRPAQATKRGARIVALSTPAGRRGWFYLEYIGGTGWRRETIKAADCARISPEFLADELRSLGPSVYEQEYCCEFSANESNVFASEMVERALSPDVLPLWSLT
jgi:hypothetical protein